MDGLQTIIVYVWLTLTAAACAAVYFLATFLLLRVRGAHPAKPPLSRFDLRAQRLPPKVRGYFDDVAVELEPFGFAIACGLFMGRQDHDQRAFVLILHHRSAHDVAIALAVYSAARDKPRLLARYVEILSQFNDQTEMRTNNSRDLPALPALPRRSVVRLPTIDAPADLYRMHQWRIAGADRADDKKPPDLADPVEFLRRSLTEELSGQAAVGNLVLDRENQLYRFTAKGALIAAWKTMWPIRWLCAAARDREAKRLLSQLPSSGPRVAPKVALTRSDKSG